MARTITLTKPNILQVTINTELQNVTILYSLTDDAGAVAQPGELVLWKDLPTPPANPDGTPGTNPPNYLQLPPASRDGLIALLQYAKSRVTALLN